MRGRRKSLTGSGKRLRMHNPALCDPLPHSFPAQSKLTGVGFKSVISKVWKEGIKNGVDQNPGGLRGKVMTMHSLVQGLRAAGKEVGYKFNH